MHALARPVVAATALLAGLAAPVGAGTFELLADTLTTESGSQTVVARGHVRVTDGVSVARAGSARYTARAGRLVLSGGVVVQTPDGTLSAREVTILLGRGQRMDFFAAVGGVQVKARTRVFNAERVTYEPPTASLHASGAVTAFIPPDLYVSGHDLAANLRNEVATLTGHVRVRAAEGFIEGDRLDADGRAQTAFIHDHVVGGFRKTLVTADTATLRAREHTAVFRGRVKIVDPTRTVTADQVTVYYRDGRVIAEGTTSVRLEEDRP